MRRKKTTIQEGNQTPLRIIPLGGLEQIGMNITAFEYEDDMIVVDCGMAFPEDDMPGVDMVIPDITYLKEHQDKLRGFFITHGHEDHIGAIPYVLKEVNAPVYGTKLTIGLIEHKLEEHGLLDVVERHVVTFGDHIEAGAFDVEFIRTNHSISDAAALAIHNPAGTVIHTGDFKVDYTPVFGDAIDLQRFAELGKEGVLALMCDSTNAERPGFTASERTVGYQFDQIFAEHPDRRIIIATFASNVDRVQQIINSAQKYGRKVVVEGRSMVNTIGTAAELGYLNIDENTLIEVDQLSNYPDEKTVLITTGSQGESMAALSRMANGTHRKVQIKPHDTVIFSSHPIPGNEKAVTHVMNDLIEKGADIVMGDVHVSGHACAEEIKLIYSLVQPRYAIPVHGELKHRTAQRRIARNLGLERERIIMASSGDVISLTQEKAEIIDHVQVGAVMVDGLGVGDVGNIVLRDRQKLSANGIVVAIAVLDEATSHLISGPEIITRGLVYVRDSEDVMDEARRAAEEAVIACEEAGITDWARIKSAMRDRLSDYIWKQMQRSPVIVPVVIGV